MIGRFADVAITFAAGLTIGYLISVVDKGGSNAPLEQVSNVSTPATPPEVESAQVTSTESAEASCPEVTRDIQQADFVTQEPMPRVYRDMIGPLTEQTAASEPYDLYAAFAREGRDEPWAVAMESGIANWSAGRNPSAEAVIDYVECRSSFCVVAGHSSTGSTGFLGTMRDEGWWQATGDLTDIVHSGLDGSAEFLLFVSRYADTNW